MMSEKKVQQEKDNDLQYSMITVSKSISNNPTQIFKLLSYFCVLQNGESRLEESDVTIHVLKVRH